MFDGTGSFAASAEQSKTAAVEELANGRPSLVWVSEGSLAVLPYQSDGRVVQEFIAAFGSSCLCVPAGCTLAMHPEKKHYTIRGTADAPIQFAGLPLDVQEIQIQLSGPQAGTLHFQAKLASSTSPLDASIRFFYPGNSPDKTPAGLIYPVLSGVTGAPVAAAISLDPSRPADPTRNHIVPLAGQQWRSNLQSITGKALQIGVIPEKSRLVSQWDPALKMSYTALDGDWSISATGSDTGSLPPLDLMCGLSGLEYAKIPDSSVIRFVAGAPAYAPDFPNAGATGGAQPFTSECPGSPYPVTTSWVYFSGGAEGPQGLGALEPGLLLGYYSQPENGSLFRFGPTGSYLEVAQVQIGEFPPNPQPVFGAPKASFPMAPYAGVQPSGPSGPEIYRIFEVEMLSPIRGNAIYQMNWPPADGPAGLGGVPCQSGTGPSAPTGPAAVTQQGMYSTFSDDYSIWKRLILASTAGQTAELQCLCTELRAALLSSQLFLVISDLEELKKCADVFFPGLTMGGWTFDLTNWRPDTVLIIKFAEKTLSSLVDDISLWSAPNSKFNKGVATQQVLQRWIQTAQENASQPEFDYFLNTVLQAWNGIIFANCNVPPGNFPSQLAGLTAGIDMEEFSAHHFGVNVAPVQITGRDIEIADSSLFGLIYYSDPLDLAYNGAPYDYKVLSLRVLFANSDIASFSSTIELLVAELFGERSTLSGSLHGDNLILNGVWQRHGDEDSYSFTQVGANTFMIASQVLDSVLVNQAQFVTISPEDAAEVSTRFLLWGALRFKKIPEMDLFSFGPESPGASQGGLQFSYLYISMTFQGSTPSDRVFGFECGQVAFDLSGSIPRPGSFYARFPLQANGMIQGNDTSKPANLGYVPLISPLHAGALGNPWFGIEMAMALGSPGGLAAKTGFTSTLLAAWAPAEKTYNAVVGLRLPGSEGGKKSLTIQGPLKLNIGNISLLYNETEKAYLMRFNNIALNFFGLSFPPGGQSNLLLFGDPDPQGTNSTLGWYAAYKKDRKGATGTSDPALSESPRVLAGRKPRKGLR